MRKILQNKDQVLRYLGHKGQYIDNSMNKLIEESIEEMKEIIHERYVFKEFNISRNKEELWLENSKFKLPGKDIRKHLFNSNQCILLGVSLGYRVDKRIRYYEKTNMTKALILDACATAAIEEISNNICLKIEEDLLYENKVLTSRYSPGYGDLPLDIQGEFLTAINGEKSIGLTSTSSGILIPRKSITAIMGIVDPNDKEEGKNCLDCGNYSTCSFRKGDEECEP